MSDLTETEIIDRMQSSLREAIQASQDLAISSRKGPTYSRLREHLGLVEGCCRQLSVWREDSRWLKIGMLMSECHKKAGGWLRGYKDPRTGQRVHFGIKAQNPLFSMLAVNLIGIYEMAELIRTAKTGKLGMILPEMPNAERRIGAPVMGHRISTGGIILPRGAN